MLHMWFWTGCGWDTSAGGGGQLVSPVGIGRRLVRGRLTEGSARTRGKFLCAHGHSRQWLHPAPQGTGNDANYQGAGRGSPSPAPALRISFQCPEYPWNDGGFHTWGERKAPSLLIQPQTALILFPQCLSTDGRCVQKSLEFSKSEFLFQSDRKHWSFLF